MMMLERGFYHDEHFRSSVSKHHSKTFVHASSNVDEHYRPPHQQKKHTKDEVKQLLLQANTEKVGARQYMQGRLNAFKQLRTILREVAVL